MLSINSPKGCKKTMEGFYQHGGANQQNPPKNE